MPHRTLPGLALLGLFALAAPASFADGQCPSRAPTAAEIAFRQSLRDVADQLPPPPAGFTRIDTELPRGTVQDAIADCSRDADALALAKTRKPEPPPLWQGWVTLRYSRYTPAQWQAIEVEHLDRLYKLPAADYEAQSQQQIRPDSFLTLEARFNQGGDSGFDCPGKTRVLQVPAAKSAILCLRDPAKRGEAPQTVENASALVAFGPGPQAAVSDEFGGYIPLQRDLKRPPTDLQGIVVRLNGAPETLTSFIASADWSRLAGLPKP